MESDVRFFRRRANEELAAAQRAVTDAARARRLVLAETFLERLKAVEACATATELAVSASYERPAFDWTTGRTAEQHA
jgi:hypothetical protein